MHMSAEHCSSKRPLVFINMAVTVDGKIATGNRQISSFGSASDYERLLKIRSCSDAIMCGAGTLNAAPVTLGNGGDNWTRHRLEKGLKSYPERILVTGSGSLNPSAKVFEKRFSPIRILTTRQAPQNRFKEYSQISDEVYTCRGSEIDWIEVMHWMRSIGIERLLCEGGANLNGALLMAGFVDVFFLTICPWIAGSSDAPTAFEGIGFSSLQEALQMDLISERLTMDGERMTTWGKSGLSRGAFECFGGEVELSSI